MADFTRLVTPNGSSWPRFPAALESWSQSGKGQFRSTLEVGRTWEEEYPPLKASDTTTRAFLAYLNSLWRNKTIFEIVHPHLETPLGTISGSVLVAGASQTGSSINIDGMTANTTLKQGDIITFANIYTVYDITANVTANGSGQATISISPPIFTGGSPADNAVVTYTGVKFRAVISNLNLPSSTYIGWYEGLSITFREAV